MVRAYHDQNWLRHQYEVLQRSWNEIARDCGVGNSVVRKFAKRYGIVSRSVSEGNAVKWADPEYRRRAEEGIVLGLSRSLDKRRLNSISLWRDVRFRQNAKLIMSSSVYKEKQRQAQRRRMLRPDQYTKAVDTLRRCTASPEIQCRRWRTWAITTGTPEYRSMLSDRSRLLHRCPEYSAKHRAGVVRTANTTEARLRRSINSLIIWQRPSYRSKMSALAKARWTQQRYRASQAAASAAQPSHSILEGIVRRLLELRGVPCAPVSHGPWSFDLGFSHAGKNYLVECQGAYWHSLPATVARDRQKKTYYDRYLADTHELHYIHEYEFYGINKICHILDRILGTTPAQIDFQFDAVRLDAVTREEANDFFWSHHYLGKSRAGLDVGARLDADLIAGCRYTGITRLQTADRLQVKPHEILELNRLCIHPAYHKRNFASWFLTRTIRSVPPGIKVLVAFSDEGAGHTGAVYKAAGWRLDGRTKSSYWYVDGDGHRYHKKSVWDQAKRLRLSEREYATATGLTRIEGKPVLRFIKGLNGR